MNTDRDGLIRTFLSDHDIDGLLLWRTDELIVALGYLPYWNVSMLLYPGDGDPILYVPELEPADNLPGDVRCKTYPWGRMESEDPLSTLVDAVLSDLRLLKISGRVGIVRNGSRSAPSLLAAESSSWPPDLVDRLESKIPNELRDVTTAIATLYHYKTHLEIQAIELANRIAAVGLGAFVEHAIAGNTEAEVAAAAESAIQCQIGKNGVRSARGWAMVQSGPNSANGGRFNLSTGRHLKRGDLVLIELATCVNGYWSDLTRTIAVGEAGRRYQEIRDVVHHAQQAAIETIRPGVSCAEVDRVARSIIVEAGYGDFFRHPTGHQVGFRYHDPGPVLAPGVEDILGHGMVVTVEPGIYGAQLLGGVRIEDNILITEDGHLVLSHFPSSLTKA